MKMTVTLEVDTLEDEDRLTCILHAQEIKFALKEVNEIVRRYLKHSSNDDAHRILSEAQAEILDVYNKVGVINTILDY